MVDTHRMPYSEPLPPTLPPQTAAWSAGQCWQLPHLHIMRYACVRGTRCVAVQCQLVLLLAVEGCMVV